MCNAYAPYCHLWPATLCSIFPPYLQRHDLGGGGGVEGIENKICVLIFSTAFVWNFFVLRRAERHIFKKMYIRFQVKYPFFLFDFSDTCTF